MNFILHAFICSALTEISLGFGLVSNSRSSTSVLFIKKPSLAHKKQALIPSRAIDSCVVLSMESETTDAEITGKVSKDSPDNNVKSILQKVDEFGLNLKPRAAEANERAQSVTDSRSQKILFTAKSCLLYSAFILYRAYRGFFVILPAVFQEVYRKMDMTLNDPFTDEDSAPKVEHKRKIPLRNAVVVSFVSFFVTLSYTVTGAYKVLAKFVATVTRTSAVEPAFQAAADEILTNEGKILKMTNEKQVVNGEELAP